MHVSVKAASISTSSTAKEKFSNSNLESTEASEAVYTNGDKNKNKSSVAEPANFSRIDDSSTANGREERAISGDTASKIKMQFSGENDTIMNKILWYLMHGIFPKRGRPEEEPKVPIRLKPAMNPKFSDLD
ncbi:hypothetical protein PHMEG_00016121 [Phytophthora megakarya]|uniref:Uncharacterized protein n=1 Tax=Phytophthora megakarya TaxID=4795 RepID=A0A225VZS1_9STRA|nr:hypothetical protein PHMEG_00016121 [Phytophthora megakarya]